MFVGEVFAIITINEKRSVQGRDRSWRGRPTWGAKLKKALTLRCEVPPFILVGLR